MQKQLSLASRAQCIVLIGIGIGPIGYSVRIQMPRRSAVEAEVTRLIAVPNVRVGNALVRALREVLLTEADILSFIAAGS